MFCVASTQCHANLCDAVISDAKQKRSVLNPAAAHGSSKTNAMVCDRHVPKRFPPFNTSDEGGWGMASNTSHDCAAHTAGQHPHLVSVSNWQIAHVHAIVHGN